MQVAHSAAERIGESRKDMLFRMLTAIVCPTMEDRSGLHGGSSF